MKKSTTAIVCIALTFVLSAVVTGIGLAGPVTTVNYTPWTGAAVAAPGLSSPPRLAATGEACGCKADQSCCEEVCCASTHPHHCANTHSCYRTLSEAQEACGSAVEVCGVPQ